MISRDCRQHAWRPYLNIDMVATRLPKIWFIYPKDEFSNLISFPSLPGNEGKRLRQMNLGPDLIGQSVLVSDRSNIEK